jgi:hypothetical protein
MAVGGGLPPSARDTSAVWPHLWGMVAELSTQGTIPATTVADAVAGDAMAFARIVRATTTTWSVSAS